MSQKKYSYIVYAQRTAIGKMSGALSQVPAPKLGAVLVSDAVKKLNIQPNEPDEIIMGNVLTAGVGQAPARQAAIYGGLSKSVCALTINRVCGSGLKSIMLADQAIRSGDAKLIFAGGQENMSLAPHLLMNSRTGYRFGPIEAKDSMQWDGLWDPYGNMSMGQCGEVCAKEWNISREAQDLFAATSYKRAQKAIESGHFKNEIVSVEITDRKGSKLIDTDEEPFASDISKFSSLKPAFSKDGTITAANASSINDGAALCVVCDEETLKKKNWQPLARIIAQASFAHEPTWFTTAPIDCIEKVLKLSNLSASQIDQYEINEAFSLVTMAATQKLKLDPERVNPFGGAVSLGHPIGASGARILATLINGLNKNNGKFGLATLCIGGGEASAVVVEKL